MTKKTDHFSAMKESLQQMRAIERGEMKPSREYTAADILGPERAALIEARRKTGLSQAKMAVVMGVSARTLQDWEQGRRNPTGAARVLIEIARTHPRIVAEAATTIGDVGAFSPTAGTKTKIVRFGTSARQAKAAKK